MIPSASLMVATKGTPLSVAISDQSLSNTGSGPPSETIGYSIDTDGNVYDNLGTFLETWLLAGLDSNAEVMATGVGDAPTGSSLGVWHAGGATWHLTTTGAAKHLVLTVHIRKIGTVVDLDTATITLDVSF
jgi:hypothetical protein